MFQKIGVLNKDSKKFLEFSKINLVFGYANSGKSTFLSELVSIFTGKDKHHLVNGTQTVPNDFNVLSLGSNEGISTHLKLSAKSLVKRLIVENKYSDSFGKACEKIEQGVAEAQSEIQDRIRETLPGTKVTVNDMDAPLNFLLDNISISMECDSSSDEKKNLFSLISSLSANSSLKTIVIIDDFDSDFDEESTLGFFDRILKTDAYFILSTKHPLPEPYLTNEETSIFCIRDFGTHVLPPIKQLLLDSIVGFPEYTTFEEYITGKGYLETSGIADLFLKAIQDSELANIQRILTSRNPVIGKERLPGKVTIVPRNDEEERLYASLFEMLGIK